MLIASSLYRARHMLIKLHLMHCICNHKREGVSSALPQGHESHIHCGGQRCEGCLQQARVSRSMTITLIIIIISISIMYYVMRGVLFEPTMSRSKDKYDLSICIYRIYYMLLNICDCVFGITVFV